MNGTAIGNPLSPFLATIFISRFETKMKKNQIFQKSRLDT